MMLTSSKGCDACPYMDKSKVFDDEHLFCTLAGKWTNLLDVRFYGHCLFDGQELPLFMEEIHEQD